MTRKAYASDVNDAEWGIIEPLLPASQPIVRRREVDLREIINGIFYVLHERCTWSQRHCYMTYHLGKPFIFAILASLLGDKRAGIEQTLHRISSNFI